MIHYKHKMMNQILIQLLIKKILTKLLKNKQATQKNNDLVKPFKNAKITMFYEYTLVTNLPIETYDDNKVKELYKQR